MSDSINAAVWTRRGPWSSLLAEGRFGATDGAAGVAVAVIDGLGMANVMVGEDQAAAFDATVRDRFGLEPPGVPVAVTHAGRQWLWSGPGRWTLIAATPAELATDLAALAPVAAVTDQSSSRGYLRLTGTQVRTALAKGCMIDLHPARFAVAAVALTSIGHVPVQLWRQPDGPAGAVFDLLVPRSMAGSFWSWLSSSAAEFGLTVRLTPH